MGIYLTENLAQNVAPDTTATSQDKMHAKSVQMAIFVQHPTDRRFLVPKEPRAMRPSQTDLYVTNVLAATTVTSLAKPLAKSVPMVTFVPIQMACQYLVQPALSRTVQSLIDMNVPNAAADITMNFQERLLARRVLLDITVHLKTRLL